MVSLLNLITDAIDVPRSIPTKVEQIILDDFQHLIDSETDKVLHKVSDWLKVLVRESRIPFLVVGLEGKVELILKANAQLSRHFAIRERLEPFRWDNNDSKSIQNFANFIMATEKVVGLPLPWRSDSDMELLFRLHYATDGVVANIMNLMRKAGREARKRNSGRLELDILADVYNKHLAKHLERPNPFKKSLDESFVGPATTPGAIAKSQKGKQRGKNTPSANDVLKK